MMTIRTAGLALVLTMLSPLAAPLACADAASPAPVPAGEVAAWAQRGSGWCMNPTDAGGCDFLAVWRPAEAGGYEFVAAEVLDASGSMFTVTQPFWLEDERQCYRVDPATVRFGTIGTPGAAALADARRRWQIGLANEQGDTFCMAFMREPATGLVHRIQWRNGIAQANAVDEVWRVRVQAEASRRPPDTLKPSTDARGVGR